MQSRVIAGLCRRLLRPPRSRTQRRECHIVTHPRERRGPSASVVGKPLLRHWHTVSPTVLAPAPRVFKHPMLSVSSKCFDFRGPRIQNSEPETSAAQLLILGSRGPRPRGSEPQTSAAQPEQRMSGALGAPAPGVRNPRHQLLSVSSVCLGFRTSRLDSKLMQVQKNQK